jgi:hypothetical protein
MEIKREKGKRGPKKGKNILVKNVNVTTNIESNSETNCVIIEQINTDNVFPEKIKTKRGRKPKGGKLILTPIAVKENNENNKPNIILHLKCYSSDLNTLYSSNVESFHLNEEMTNFENIKENKETIYQDNYYVIDNKPNFEVNEQSCETENKYSNEDIKEIWKKLKQLETNLHLNTVVDKKSACFWCTYDFDNPSIYIPKYYIIDSYYVYGCFCSPECACAYLMKENIDNATKFERYQLLNHIYSKIYSYKKNIKPSPNPYYLLNKFYGNLSIQEYRSLLQNERLFLIVDKPLTRIMPELIEDNDEFILNKKIIPSNSYTKKKQIQKNGIKTNTLFC